MTSAIAVAQAFLDLASEEGQKLSNMQLQKLVFFAHGVHLAAYDGKPLIDDPIKAWDFGPVIPSLYERLRKYGKGTVDPNLAPETRGLFDPEGHEQKTIQVVWNAYKGYDAWALSDISHQENSPWHKAWTQSKYSDIPDGLILDYYKNRVKRKDGSHQSG